jgi:hypothetical protein
VQKHCQQQRQIILSQLQAGNNEAVRRLVIDIYDTVEADLEQAIAMARAIEAQPDTPQGNGRGDSSHDMR